MKTRTERGLEGGGAAPGREDSAGGAAPSSVRVFREAELGQGAFDGGKITEIKPIPFPQEGGGAGRIGPLFYWAWASARGDGVIGMHPHRGFEILSYVLEGEVGHSDTGGNRSRVGAGGAQVMQTGSGISHQEEMYGECTDFFQIWFEPDMKKALREAPRYADFAEGDFPVEELGEGVRVKKVIGKGGPVELAAEVEAGDVTLAGGVGHGFVVPADHALAMVVIEGGGVLVSGDGAESAVAAREFAVIVAGGSTRVEMRAGGEGARVFVVQVPTTPGYALMG